MCKYLREYYPPKPGFYRAHVEAALAGNLRAIYLAMTWSQTPQGREFWKSQYQTGLNQEGRAYLQYLLTL